MATEMVFNKIRISKEEYDLGPFVHEECPPSTILLANRIQDASSGTLLSDKSSAYAIIFY